MSLGGADGDRTHDLQIANLALSQLSYCPKAQNLTTKTMAEREGFEPSVAVRATHDFQSCTFGHSVISPLVKLANIRRRAEPADSVFR